jgi:hypothetical protein
MSFNNLGPVTSIASGSTQRWWYRRSEAVTTAFKCRSRYQDSGAELTSFDQSKLMENDGSTTYHVSIRNSGGVPCLYNLQGGGAS